VAHAQHGFDLVVSNADGTGEMPFPTVIVVDANSRGPCADAHVDYTTRPEVPEILAPSTRWSPPDAPGERRRPGLQETGPSSCCGGRI
jgi:hypothetical protein